MTRVRRSASAFLLFLTGCYIPLSSVDRNTKFDATSRYAVVAFGLSPNFSVTLMPGEDDGVTWHCGGGPVRRVRPENGFVVAKLPPRTGRKKYAIVLIGTDGFPLGNYGPSGFIHAFDAPAGQVTYLGSFKVAFEADGRTGAVVPSGSGTREQAATYLARTYPGIASPIEDGRMELLYLDHPCWN